MTGRVHPPLALPDGVVDLGVGTVYNAGPEPPPLPPENPALDESELRSAAVAGLDRDAAFAAKMRAYAREMQQVGGSSLEQHLALRPRLARQGILPASVDIRWTADPEPHEQAGMSRERFQAMGKVTTLSDFEEVREDERRRAEARAEAQHQLDVERARRELESGDAAA